MDISCRLSEGLQRGIRRHWEYTKDFLKVKPEYLLTISVADELTKGFDGISGMDVEIRLEETTRSIAFDLVAAEIGIERFIKSRKPKISRKGKIDIFAITPKSSYVIELKGFDPSLAEIRKDLIRIQELLGMNEGRTKLISGFLAFPTQHDRSLWIEKQTDRIIDGSEFTFSLVCEKHLTGESPEDGIPCYYSNVLSVFKT